MTEPVPTRRLPAALGTAAAFGIPAALFLVRFEAFVRGGVFSFRDAGFFFVPWRTETARLLARGSFPFWNDPLSGGRALAADPNAAIFWPLTPLVVPLGTTALGLANAAAALVLFFVAARRLGVSRGIAAAVTVALLFSGVFQTLALLFTSMAAFAPVGLALVAARALGGAEGAARLRWQAVLAAALALSTFGGEPAITVMGGLGALGVAAFAGGGRAFGRAAAAAALGAALAAVQVVPAAGELLRSTRGQRMRAEEGALYFSVRPSRALTLLEPRLTGDPFAETDDGFWGAGTFDARNPYFYDIAFGLLPLLLAGAATACRPARGLLAVAAAGGVLSFARFLPGYAALARWVAIFRYPEKWWALTTAGCLLAGALAIAALAAGDRRVARRLQLFAGAAAVPLAAAAFLALAFPGALRGVLWALSLGAGPAPAARVAGLLAPRLLAGAGLALATLLLAWALARGLVPFRAAAAAGAALFLCDAAVRVAASCPAGDPALFRRPSPLVRAAVAAQGPGRFVDAGADDRETAARRMNAAGGFDQLRPATGVLFGVRYAGENDVDRMTPYETFEWARSTAVLPWGAEKVRRWRCAGVTVARIDSPGPDPAGVRTLAREGPDRLMAIGGSRPEFALLPRALFVPPRTSLAAGEGLDPAATLVVEDAVRRGAEPCGAGTVRLLERGANRIRLELRAEGGPACLAVARTYDPSWRVLLDGREAAMARADGCFSALLAPAGTHRVEIRYANPLFAWGAAISLATLAGLALLLLRH